MLSGRYLQGDSQQIEYVLLVRQVDIHSWKSKNARIQKQLLLICGILCGLVVAEDYRKGQQLVTDRNFAANADFFQAAFQSLTHEHHLE